MKKPSKTEPLSAKTYAGRAIAHCKLHYGQEYEGAWPVIDKDEHPKRWKAWQLYFERIGCKVSARMMRLGDRQKWGVPEPHPVAFDPDQAKDLLVGDDEPFVKPEPRPDRPDPREPFVKP